MTRELGADPAQLDELGRRFDLSAQTLTEMGQAVSTRLTHVEWFGQDAEQVRYDWQSYYHGRFFNVADVLRELAQTLRRNAENQRRTSEDPGGSANGNWFHPFDRLDILPPYICTPYFNIDPFLDGAFNLLRRALPFLDLADLANSIKELGKYFPDPQGILKMIPEDLVKLGKKIPIIGDLLGIAVGMVDGDPISIAFGVVGLGLGAVIAVSSSPLIVGAAVVGTVAVNIFEAIYDFGPGIVDGAQNLIHEGGKLIGPAVEAISSGIADGVDAVVDVAAPIVEGAKEFAGDVWEAGGKMFSDINPFD